MQVEESKYSSEESRSPVTDYDIIKVLGKGTQGNVYLVKYRKDQQKYALKVINKAQLKQKETLNRLISEVSVQKHLSEVTPSCDNILMLKSHFEDEGNVYIAMELCENGDLLGLLRK